MSKDDEILKELKKLRKEVKELRDRQPVIQYPIYIKPYVPTPYYVYPWNTWPYYGTTTVQNTGVVTSGYASTTSIPTITNITYTNGTGSGGYIKKSDSPWANDFGTRKHVDDPDHGFEDGSDDEGDDGSIGV